jgi:hypothetical protein
MNAHALPRGCGPLLVAELVARELDAFMRDSVDIPRIVPIGSRPRARARVMGSKWMERK